MNHYLLELSKRQTEEVEKSKRKFYWQCGDYKFNNYNLARWYEQETQGWVDFCDNQIDQIKLALSNTKIDLDKNYNIDFIKLLKEKFETVNLLFSGGYESATIFYEFVENKITIDETLTIIGQENEPEITGEMLSSVNPMLESHGEFVKKKTIMRHSQQWLLDFFKDEYALFAKPFGDTMPPVHTYLGVGFVRPNISEKHCWIKGMDKPQLVYYKNRWYVTVLDILGAHYELAHLTYFWLDADNIKSLVKDALLYRKHLIASGEVTKDFHFFKFYSQDHLNYVINRRTPPGVDKKLPKLEKRKIRMTRQLEAENFQFVYHYTRCMNKVIENIPSLSNGFDDYQGSAKFAWFIDIDSLDVYTQRELIPNGF